MYDNESMVLRALDSGATGYLTKSSGMGQMVEAVRRVADAEPYIDATLVATLSLAVASGRATNPLQVLTAREFQVFQRLAEGHTVREISAALEISPKTVGVHRASVMRKLGLRSAAQLARLAVRCNVIAP
jgi:two-component system invasion response regulator UvrY